MTSGLLRRDVYKRQDVIRIRGVEKLHRTEYSIIPDQIEADVYKRQIMHKR